MGESRILCCPEVGYLMLTGCDAEKSCGSLSIGGVCKIGCDAAGSCLGEREYGLVDAGEVFVVREGRGLNKGVVELVKSRLTY